MGLRNVGKHVFLEVTLEFPEDLFPIPDKDKAPLVHVLKKDFRSEHFLCHFVMLPPVEIGIFHCYPDPRDEDDFDRILRDGAGLVIDLNG